MFIFETDITHNDPIIIRQEIPKIYRQLEMTFLKYEFKKEPNFEQLWKFKGGIIYIVCLKEFSKLLFTCEAEYDLICFRDAFGKSIFKRCNRFKNFKARLFNFFKKIAHGQEKSKLTLKRKYETDSQKRSI